MYSFVYIYVLFRLKFFVPCLDQVGVNGANPTSGVARTHAHSKDSHALAMPTPWLCQHPRVAPKHAITLARLSFQHSAGGVFSLLIMLVIRSELIVRYVRLM